MIPRLQARGRSFKGSCTYVLHDPKAKTRDRVAWTLTRNLHSDPDHVWFEMYETWRNQAQLKANAGLSARGRKNETPVLHYTLAWHIDDKPTPEQMQAAALASLRVLGLEEHEALIVAHDDKTHPHVHIVANTVHPYTGRTAALKYSKERLSEWAEAYEREHGRIHCEERVKNNEERRNIRKARAQERLAESFAPAAAPPPKMPYVPVKDNSPTRPQWFDRKEIVDRMKRLRAELDLQHKAERGATWERQKTERDALDRDTQAAIDNARAHMRERFRPQWRALYGQQGRERRVATSGGVLPLERAVFVFKNRHRLSGRSALSLRQIVGLVLSPARLARALESVHLRERRTLARDSRLETKQLTERIWAIHRERFHTLRERQAQEREAERAHQRLERKDVTLARAKAHLIEELARPAPLRPQPRPPREALTTAGQFNLAAVDLSDTVPAPVSRADQIRRDMEIWRQQNGHRDIGREF